MRTLITTFLFLTLTGAISQTKIGGVIMPNKVKYATDQYLTINGGGIREKMMLDLYIGVLYLKEKSSDANKIINADEPMAVKLRVISSLVSKENMEEAIRTGFDKSTGGNTAPLKSKIDQLITNGFKDEISVGDVFDLIYVPGTGTTMYKNNSQVTTIAGFDFKKALFGIWLCGEPADENLKNKMLGK